MSDTVSRIKEKIEIAELIRSYMELKPAGKNLKGLCPFHKEKTPSFIVSPDRGTWHCFGCGIGGDLIAFLMKYEGLEFLEALKVLADRAGIPLERFGASGEKQYAVLYAINAAAKEFFVEELARDTSMARAAREYLATRGLTPETIQSFEIGFAPSSSDGLTRALATRGYQMTDIERAGLVFKTERGTYWDRFRGRIMFPLMNTFGKTVGFTGRIMPQENAIAKEGMAAAKYVNSPETPIFNKSKLLFGLHKSKSAIRETKTAVLVEGQMDMVMAWQDGVTNVIATSGTALSADHLLVLRRSADTLVLFFDADEAGQSAMERVIDLASTADFSVRVAYASGEAKDPADIVQAHPGALQKMIADAVPAMKHYFRQYVQGVSKTKDMAELKRGIRTVLQKIAALASPVERSVWVRELSLATDLSEEHLFAELQALPKKGTTTTEKKEALTSPQMNYPAEELSRHERIAEQFISLALADETLLADARAHSIFLPHPYEALWKALFASTEEAPSVPTHLAPLSERAHLLASFATEDAQARRMEFEDVVRNLRKEHFHKLQDEWKQKIRLAESTNDEALLATALAEFHKASQEKGS